jgi:hypothetical protein
MFKKYSIYSLLVIVASIIGLNNLISQEAGETRYYSGSIAEKLTIMSKLTFEKSKITGNYFYTNKGHSIELSGEADKDGNFSLKEEIYDVKKEEYVTSGLIKGKCDASFNSFNGEWTNPKGTKKFPFVLKMIASTKKKQMKDFEVYVSYPVLSGNKASLAFNTELEKYMNDRFDTLSAQIKNDYKEAEDEEIKKEVKERYSYTIDCDIQYISDNLYSIVLLNYANSGGAHPGTWFTSVNYCYSNGRVASLKLSDLFKPNSNYLKTVSDICIIDLKKQGASLVVDGDVTDFNENMNSGQIPFSITPKGLRFNFSAYEAASYAEGDFVVIIPFDKLNAILKTDGVMAELLKK